MFKKKSNRTGMQMAGLGAGGGVVFTSVLAAIALEPATTTNNDIQELVNQCVEVNTMHFVSTVQGRVFAPDPESGLDEGANGAIMNGTLEYWAAGDMYRLKSYLDPSFAYGVDTEIAYDGQLFQYFDKRINTLSVSSIDTAMMGLSLPHPLLEWLQFAYPMTDDNAQYRKRLKDVKANPPDLTGAQWTVVQQGESLVEQAFFPGGTYDDVDYTYRVTVIPGDRRKPIRIDRVNSIGNVLTTAVFSNFEHIPEGSNSQWPRSIVLRTFGGDGSILAEMSFVITELSVNDPIPPMACTIDWHEAARVWHSDIEAFIAHE